MYVKIDKNYKVNLMEMTFEEAVALKSPYFYECYPEECDDEEYEY